MLFFTVLFTIILAGAEVDLFIPSFTDLIREFGLSPSLVQLTLSVNFLSYSISSLFVGSMGDRYGRRPIILWGLAIFILGSLFCVTASSFSELVIGRFLQGVGMAAPAVLGYVVIADTVPIEKQAGMVGFLNGMITFAMAFAPVIGSYVNIHFGWQGSFWGLLGGGVVSWILSYLFLPNNFQVNREVSLSLKGYLPLLRSWSFMKLLFIICAIVSCYWVFIGMGPILYMSDMNVALEHFGFYQGAIAGIFSIMSILSPTILKRIPQEVCLRWGMWLLLGLALILLGIGAIVDDAPWLITVMMSLYVVPMVFPINILYPLSLEVIPSSKGRAAALMNFGRLAFSAIGLEVISHVYTGHFLAIAIFIFVLTLLAFIISIKIIRCVKP